MPVFRKHTEAPPCSCQACADSGLVEAGLGASTPRKLPPLPRGSWAPGRTTSGGGPVPPRLLECGMPPLCQHFPCAMTSLGAQFWFAFHCSLFVCSFIPACVRPFFHSFSFIHSKPCSGLEGRPEHAELASSPCSELGVRGQIT